MELENEGIDTNEQNIEDGIEATPTPVAEPKLSMSEQLQAKAEKIAEDSKPRSIFDKKNIAGKSKLTIGKKEEPVAGKKDIDPKKIIKKPEDLTDENGNIIAKAGAERRIMEEGQKAKTELKDFRENVLPILQKNYNEAMNTVKQLQELDGLVKANNLTHEELATTARIAVEFKKNPTQALKMMLTNAIDQGYDVSEIVNAGQQKSLEKLLSEKLSPLQKLVQERELQDEELKRTESIKAEVKTFYDTFPNSQLHSKEIAAVTEKLGLEPSPENWTKAYFKLQEFYSQKGYDFGKLWNQIESKTSIAPKIKKTVIDDEFESGDLPTNTRNSLNYNGENRPSKLGVNSSYADIIRSAMSETKE